MQQVIETHLPHLSRPQLTGLVLWGVRCYSGRQRLPERRGLGTLSLGQMEQPAPVSPGVVVRRQRPGPSLPDRTGRKSLLPPLLRWVLAWWRSGRLALAVDPTLKGDQTPAIVLSVVYRSCAIPVAWRIHRATQRGSWMDPTVELLRELAPAVPKEMTVIVLCDRGIASPKLWRQIRAQGWHPYMRYRKNVSFCAQDGRRLPAQHFVSRPDTAWIGRGTAFSAPPPQNAAAPCWRSGTSSRKNPGSSSLTCHRRTPDPVGTPCASGWNWASRPSKAWAGSGTKPGAPTQRVSPATGWCCRWRRCWPRPTAPGWKTPMTAGLPQATCARRPKPDPYWIRGRRLPGAATPGAGRYGPSASSATASTG